MASTEAGLRGNEVPCYNRREKGVHMSKKRQHQLLLGYARRMEEVARLTLEMKDIQTKYEREFGPMTPEVMIESVVGDRMAKLADELRADARGGANESVDNVLEAAGDTRPVVPGSALGLVPVPEWLTNDGLGDDLTVAEQVARDA